MTEPGTDTVVMYTADGNAIDLTGMIAMIKSPADIFGQGSGPPRPPELNDAFRSWWLDQNADLEPWGQVFGGLIYDLVERWAYYAFRAANDDEVGPRRANSEHDETGCPREEEEADA